MVEEDAKAHSEYTIKNGRLYRLILHTLDFNEADPGIQWKICVPRAEQRRVLKAEHDEPVAGHLGRAKTLARLARKYFWPGMLRTAAKYVRTCPSCQRFKTQQRAPAGKIHARNVEQPLGAVSVDLVGPLPRSTAGHTWLLVMQDRCTKWVELRPIRKATRRAVAETVRDQICLRHGCPDVIVTDNGRQFTSHEFDYLLKAGHVKHKPTPTYTLLCNPVERTNRVTKTMIAQTIAKNQTTWDRNVPALAFAYNSAQHGSTGHSPADLNYGRELKSPGSLEQEAALPRNDGNVRRIQRLQEALELARVKIAQSFQKQKNYYDLRRRSWTSSIGDKVLKKTQHLFDKAANFNAKLAEKFDGPYVVKKKPSPVIFDL